MITATAARFPTARRAARFTATGLLTTAASIALLPATTPPAAAAPSASSCHQETLRVELPTGGMTATVSGTLCTPAEWADGEREIDVLVHGGSYNRSYWDWPLDTERYSYVRRANADGRATFAYDRLGVGENSRPPSALVTVSADAHVLHQVIDRVREDYSTVNVVSHSIGGLVAMEEAARFDDVDTLVVTGMLHGVGVGVGGGTMLANFYPAVLDPAFGAKTTDPGWVTTLPGTRASSFYNTETADPDVIAYDEAHKDVTTETTLLTSLLSNKLPSLLNPAAGVRAPVLVMVGHQDALFCGILLDCSNQEAVYANEAPYYPQAESLTVETVPDTGHDLALHPSSGYSYSVINDWLAELRTS